jgi:hypothetical protein
VREIAKGSRDRRRTEAQRGPESAQEPSDMAQSVLLFRNENRIQNGYSVGPAA